MTIRLATSALLLAGLLAAPCLGADVGPDPKDVKAVRDKAVAFLKEHQGKDGGFSPKFGPGVSALVVTALLRSSYSPDDPLVASTMKFLEGRVRKDGGIYDKRLANYTTSVALMAFKDANVDKKYDTILRNGAMFLRKLQNDDPGADGKNVKFGGVGYDSKDKGRADLSNTQYFLDALLAAGVPKDDPAVQRALKFISRCQNLAGEDNDQPFAKKARKDDVGGLTYVPDPDDNKHATGDGGLRSLGAMTYAGLKSFLYAGVDRKDPRVQGAVKWIRRHYTLDENSGMGQSGLYYYFHTFAKAMDALGENHLEDAKGVKHDWRKELFEAIKKRQRDDGSFINTKGDASFGEKDPNLATAFALLALSYTKVPGK
jgi:squalene-hopene/tetraprenyl-beta-curcumene cyclase